MFKSFKYDYSQPTHSVCSIVIFNLIMRSSILFKTVDVIGSSICVIFVCRSGSEMGLVFCPCKHDGCLCFCCNMSRFLLNNENSLLVRKIPLQRQHIKTCVQMRAERFKLICMSAVSDQFGSTQFQHGYHTDKLSVLANRCVNYALFQQSCPRT